MQTSTFEWTKNKSIVFKRLALTIGVCTILLGGFVKAIEFSGTLIIPEVTGNISIGIILLLIAIFYIIITHNSLLKNVTIRLLWKHQSQFAGIYAAQESGIFQKAGLNVKIKKT